MPARICFCLVLSAFATFSGAISLSKDEPAYTALLRIDDQQYLSGSLVGSSADNTVRWTHPSLSEPIDLAISELKRIDTDSGEIQAGPSSFAFEFDDGDCIIGELRGIVDDRFRVFSRSLGDVEFESKYVRIVRHLEPVSESVIDLVSPMVADSHLADKGWKPIARRLVSQRLGASLVLPIDLPQRCRIDLRIQWEDKPDFVIAIGNPSTAKISNEGLRLETLADGSVVLVHESPTSADIVSLWRFESNDNSFACSLYLDRLARRLTVYTNTGVRLGSISWPDDKPLVKQNIAIASYASRLTLQNLNVYGWEGRLPYADPEQDTALTSEDYNGIGLLKAFDPSTSQLSIEDVSGKSVVISSDKLQSIKNPLFVRPYSQRNPAPEDRKRVVRVTLADASEISGYVLQSELGSLVIRAEGLGKDWKCPVGQITSLVRRYPEPAPAVPLVDQRMTLSIPGIELLGTLVGDHEVNDSAYFRFQPFLSVQPLSLNRSAKGSLRVTRSMVQPQTQVFVPGDQVGFRLPSTRDRGDEESASAYQVPERLQLRSGDVIDAEIISIHADGIDFRSESTSTTFLPHHVVESAQLHSVLPRQAIDAAKIQRLLTVPRLRKEFPPTHLLITVTGDYIRGRIQSADQQEVIFDENETLIQIPRSRVAAVLWLHERTWEEEELTSLFDAETFYAYVQTRSKDQFTIRPQRFDRGKMLGNSPWLGDLRIPLSEIDSIVFGTNFQTQIDQHSKTPWKLSLAASPKVFEEAARPTDRLSLSQQSPLVSKPAPNFELRDLDGHSWRLGNQNGRVVVLDFWASWCGPCLATMPTISNTVQDSLGDRGLWVGVNLQESESRARLTLERLGLTGVVVLDELGAVANEYAIESIPTTIVIDAEGIVRHVFTGGDEAELAALKSALDELAAKL